MIHFSSALILFLLGISDDFIEGNDGGTDAAQADAHLMQGTRIAGAHAALVDDDLAEAILPDGAESLPAGEVAVEMEPRRLLGFRRGAHRKLIAAFGLRLHRKAQGHACREPARHGKELGRIAFLQLDLDLMHWRPALGGFDLAAVDRDFDFGAVAFDMVEAALDAGLEQRPQAFGCVTLQQRLERRAGDRAQVGLRPGDRLLPFRTVEQFAGPITLDRLHIASVRFAHAQGEPRFVQRGRVRVVIDRDQSLPVEPYPGEQGMGFDGGKIGGIEFKFKLELSWLSFGLSRHHSSS